MAFVFLIIAGISELFGVLTIHNLTRKKSAKNLAFLILAFSFSFLFLYLAMRDISMGVAYAIWTGIGAAGGATVSTIVNKEPMNIKRFLAIGAILISVIGLKIIS